MIAVAVALAVLVSAELVLRLPTVEGAIGRPDLYYHFEVQARLERADRVLVEHGRIDVLFVGSSVAHTNISPHVFDEAAEKAGYDLVSFNGGMHSLFVDANRLYLENLWLDTIESQIVVQFVRYEEVVTPRLLEEWGGFDRVLPESLWKSDSPFRSLGLEILERSMLAQHSGLLTAFLASPRTAFRDREPTADDRGWLATQDALAELRATVDVTTIHGGVAGTVGYQEPIDDAVYVDGLNALAATIDDVRKRGMIYVLVNMPEHGDKFGRSSDGAARYDHYLGSLAAFATLHGVEFIDLTDADPGAFADDDLFADFNHMTPAAATDLTLRLFEPWRARA